MSSSPKEPTALFAAPKHLIFRRAVSTFTYMKITIDHNYCAGCGVCCNTAPSLFYMNGYQAEVTPESQQLLEQDELLVCRLFEVAQNCPTGSLFIDCGETDTRERSAGVLPFRKAKQ